MDFNSSVLKGGGDWGCPQKGVARLQITLNFSPPKPEFISERSQQALLTFVTCGHKVYPSQKLLPSDNLETRAKDCPLSRCQYLRALMTSFERCRDFQWPHFDEHIAQCRSALTTTAFAMLPKREFIEGVAGPLDSGHRHGHFHVSFRRSISCRMSTQTKHVDKRLSKYLLHTNGYPQYPPGTIKLIRQGLDHEQRVQTLQKGLLRRCVV